MKIKHNLIYFNVMNKNGRIYTKNSYDFNKLNNKTIYGELGHPDNTDISLSNISHTISNIENYQNCLIGEVNVLSTTKGKILKSMIDNGIKVVFRPRSTGNVDRYGNVTLEKLYTFDAILLKDDSFENVIVFRRKKIEKIMKNIKDNELL